MNLSDLKSSRAARSLVLAVMVLSAVGLVVGPMMGGRASRRASSTLTAKQRQELEQEAASLQQRLSSAQQKALRSDPTLSQRQDRVVALIESRMRAGGTDPTQFEQSVKELQRRAEDTKLPEPQRRKAMEEAVTLVQGFQKARATVLRESAVATELRSFRQDLLGAMKKQDPSVTGLIEKLEETEAKLELL